jgi:transposase
MQSLDCRYKQRFTVLKVKHSASVMVWGCFSGHGGRGSIFFLPPKMTMNSDCYIAMLDEKLFRFMDLHSATRFLQDGAPCHTSKKVMEFLKEKRIAVMDWPCNSPDLNPIKNLWSILKKKLKDDHTSDQEAVGDTAQRSNEKTGALHAQEAESVHGE